ncbi:MaoC family dehydratase [Yunchengibacter salinarum]|uniref:MaoC family dehydratase n=1 Tax=Yunchengibacter salinarum TaxID=3133399 RepID=UPI0035B59473
MSKTVKPEDVATYVGQEVGVSDWFPIDQDRINAFADVTKDHQFIHVDREAAAKTPFGTTIAHGFLTLSMLSYLIDGATLRVEGTVMGLNYGFEKVRFLAPVKVDSRIRLRVTIGDVQDKGAGRLLIRQDVTMEIEGEERPALTAQWLTMIQVA